MLALPFLDGYLETFRGDLRASDRRTKELEQIGHSLAGCTTAILQCLSLDIVPKLTYSLYGYSRVVTLVRSLR